MACARKGRRSPPALYEKSESTNSSEDSASVFRFFALLPEAPPTALPWNARVFLGAAVGTATMHNESHSW